MDPFRTPIRIEPKSILDSSLPFISLGSCFADSIGRRLEECKWSSLVNPFGTLFHPFSVFQLLHPPQNLPDHLYLSPTGDFFYHYWLPKTVFARTRGDFDSIWAERRALFAARLSQAPVVLLLTLGTSYIYEKDGDWVTNCHQQPGGYFQKRLASLAEMQDAWYEALQALPDTCQVIVSVSPVRHLKEGLVENSLSKSLLRVLAHEMVKGSPGRVHYFPAFEIMMDELRDYRFYTSDMLHPTEQAIDFIWKKFQAEFFTDQARQNIATWEKIKARLDHRPSNPHSLESKSFLVKLKQDLLAFPNCNVDAELKWINDQLSRFP